AAAVERCEVRAAGGTVDTAVITAIDDGERTGLRGERPRMGVGVQSGEGDEGLAGIGGARLADGAEIDDVVVAVAGRGGRPRHVEAVATLGVEWHADARRNARVVRRAQGPGETLIGGAEDAYGIGSVGGLRRPVDRPSLDGDVEHLDAACSGRRGR